ncbi:MAG: DNA polymerase III subunit gamma/tau, partial [Alphaproteobacteria bacterium]|nr:DNA polymerase III subunit gamma/tau [Alphaproteobacteria bacterium]
GIMERRHIDVLEMDAASHSGVDDVRQINDSVRYALTSARYMVYIIDEVHMLSKQAFNALLKTLEEPPPHVKFIFATTEIRKVPVTVLSRCQRFDLRRVEPDVLAPYFTTICGREGVNAEPAAIDIIARAADGSVRDGLSLLDQAIALGQGTVAADDVARMLGLADRALSLTLFASAMRGEPAQALAVMERQHQAGADLLVVLQDLLEIAHDLTLLKALEGREDAFRNTGLPLAEIETCRTLARDLPMPALQRAWSILLKGLQEAQYAPDTRAAAHMAVMRLIYAADLPDPARLIRDLQSGQAGAASYVPQGAGANERTPAVRVPQTTDAAGPGPMLRAVAGGGAALALARHDPVAAMVQDAESPLPQPENFEALVALCEDRGEMLLASQLINHTHPVRYEIGRFEFRPAPGAPANLAQRLGTLLNEWTGRRWMIALSTAEGDATLLEKKNAARESERAAVLESPHVRAVLSVFPGAELHRIIKD